MPDIVLATINARYVHASLGLRCLYANLGELRAHARIVEFVSGAGIESMLERVLALRPRIVGFGVYIWNVEETTRMVAQLKRVAPEVRVVVGGPEVGSRTNIQRGFPRPALRCAIDTVASYRCRCGARTTGAS